MISLNKTRKLAGTVKDEMRFLKTWADNPLRTGAVSPSGPALAKKMASHVNPRSRRPILELGPGTGPVTKALLERGVAPDNLVSVEYDPTFCALLRERYPGVNVVEGDAYDLTKTLPDEFQGPFSAVVSSLPLMTKPPAIRADFLDDIMRRLSPDGVFIQFSYHVAAPIKAETFEVDVSGWIMLNIPPARGWTYRHPGAAAIAA